MSARVRLGTSMLAMALSMGVAGVPTLMQAQEKQGHVVSAEELNRDAAKPVETRQAYEAAVRHLLTSQAGQEALKSAHVDYQKVDRAIGRLNEEELARLADRSRQAEGDFAAGFISAKHLAEVILVIVVVVTIIVLV